MRSPRARRPLLLAVAAVLLAAVARVAVADTVTTPVTGGSWFWSQQIEPPPNTVQQRLPTPDVPANDFAVALRNGQSDKETFIHLDTSTIADGSTVSGFKLTLKEDSAASGNINQTGAAIDARMVTDFFADGASGNPYSQEPGVSKTPSAPGTRAADGTWTFDITSIVEKWASGDQENFGVALVPDAGSSTVAFEVVWSGTGDNGPRVKGDVTPPAGDSSGASSFPDTGGSTSPIDTSPPVTEPASTPSFTPDLAPPAPAATTAPSTTAPTPNRLVAAPAAARTHRGLPLAFLPAGLLVLAALVATGFTLGDAGEPGTARQGSVVRRLERRDNSTA